MPLKEFFSSHFWVFSVLWNDWSPGKTSFLTFLFTSRRTLNTWSCSAIMQFADWNIFHTFCKLSPVNTACVLKVYVSLFQRARKSKRMRTWVVFCFFWEALPFKEKYQGLSDIPFRLAFYVCLCEISVLYGNAAQIENVIHVHSSGWASPLSSQIHVLIEIKTTVSSSAFLQDVFSGRPAFLSTLLWLFLLVLCYWNCFIRI